MSRQVPKLSEVTATVEWTRSSTTPGDLDLDLSAFIVGSTGHVLSESHFVFNAAESPDKSVRLSSSGGRQKLIIDTAAIPAAAQAVIIAVSVYDNLAHFSELRDARIVVNDANAGLLADFSLAATLPDDYALAYAELRREDDHWLFLGVGEAHNDLKALTAAYGIAV